ncbi:MAG: hypothetical protein ACOC08_04130 [Campylobacterales bacterium]
MQTQTLRVKDGALDKLDWLLAHLKDDVEIVEDEQDNRSENWREVLSSISKWDIKEENVKMKSWQVEDF